MTETPGNPSGERERDERVAEHLKGRLAQIGEMALAVGSAPDLADVWHDPDFAALPEAERNALREWAVSQGYAKKEDLVEGPAEEAEAAAPEPPEPEERDENVKLLMDRAEKLADMAFAVGSKPDLTDVWTDPDFLALDPEAQRRMRDWADRHGYAGAPAAPRETARATARPEPAAPEAERRNQPRKRQFIGYRLKRKEEDGEYIIIEDFEEWDRQAEEYKKRSVRTAIDIPPSLAERMKADPALEGEVAEFCAGLRSELDNKVKVFVDRRKDEPERIFPKWKYPLGGKTVEEPIRLEDLPAEIAELLKREPENYHRAPEWKKWFGKQMQRKRETVIGGELAKAYSTRSEEAAPVSGREAESAPAPESAAPAESRAETPAPAEGTKTREWKPEELKNGVRVLVEKLAPLFETPGDAPKLIEYLSDFARGSFLKHGITAQGEPIPEAALAEIIREALVERYRASGDRETLAEIEKLLPSAAAGERVAAREAAASKFGEAYVGLREQTELLKTPADLARFVVSLRELRKSGVGEARDAAGKLLLDIEQGKAGALSEDRMEGVVRSAEEIAFFAAHPALDKRNVEALRDGRVIAHIDRLHPEEAIRRTLVRVTDDALGVPALAGAEMDVRGKVAEYLTKIVSGARAGEDVSEKVRSALASYDGRAGELVIKDLEKLKGTILQLRKDLREQAGAKD